MGVYDCDWPFARDGITVILWWVVVLVVWIKVSEGRVCLDITKSLLVLLALGLVVVWEFTIAFIFVCCCVVVKFPSLSPDKYFPSLSENWDNWDNWGYDVLSLDAGKNASSTPIQST
jgi:energy-coupling factor transporter transmembrane protein EcfT